MLKYHFYFQSVQNKKLLKTLSRFFDSLGYFQTWDNQLPYLPLVNFSLKIKTFVWMVWKWEEWLGGATNTRISFNHPPKIFIYCISLSGFPHLHNKVMIFFWVFESTNSGLYLDQWRWLKQRPRRVVVECDGFEQWLLLSLFVAIHDLIHILKLISNIQTKHEDSTKK